MRKLIYLLTAVTCSIQVYAQNATASKNHELKQQVHVINNQQYVVTTNNENGAPVDNTSFLKQTAGSRAGGDLVGNTSYDLPTNGTAPNRLIVYPDGTVSAVFTGSTNTTSSRPDRGTFFNYFDGASWGAAPTTRVEDLRTGFPAIVSLGDHEMFFAHDGSNNIVIYENDENGSAAWTPNANTLTLTGTWPRAAVAEGSNYIHLVVANNDAANTNNFMLYYRSPDGGATWDIKGLRLPGIDTASGISVMGGECYTIRAIGNEVFIAAGESINDLAVWKSNDNGAIGSWTKTRLIEFPQPNFDGNTISDINADGVADTILNHDGSIAMVVDNSGMMHVWAGVTRILDVEAGDDAWTYFPGTAGIWYWNETFGADSVQYLDFTLVDWDEDGDPFLGIGADIPNYGCGFTSQPSATVDPSTGTIYVVYTHPVEFTDYFEDPTVAEAQSFRDLFGMYSTDNGFSWSSPINLSYVAEQNYENVNPTVFYNTVNDKVHVLWMQDQEPGNSLETEAPDAITLDNNILYRAFDYARFDPYDPTAAYDYSGPANVIAFNNLSVDADSYSWNFGDGATSTASEPSHVFAEIGSYLVCLNAINKYGEDQDCKTIEITQTTDINALQLSEAIKVFPTITNGPVQINLNNINESIALDIISLNGQLVSQSILNNQSNEINLSDLPAGEYMLRFISHSSVVVKHISLMK